MRKNLFAIISVFSLLMPLTALGQNVIEDDYHIQFEYFEKGDSLMIDLEGLHIGQKADSARVVSIFGIPDKYYKCDEEYGLTEVYSYGKCFLHFEANGCFLDFTLTDNRFAALIDTIEGGVRVGDPISKLDNYVTGKPVLIGVDDSGNDIYAINKYLCDITRFFVKNGIINIIVFSYIP
ncbi:MAG: hypothetical protein ACI3ZT_04515 [Candidatus Cryptobacteroides sp.]